jgi:tRNA-uridine 2-sulfurtransferase
LIKKQKVLLGMSGGTDSSVAAMLLLRRGYDVQGITFRFFEGENSTNEYLADAASVCSKLHIKHHVYDARDIFREKIIDYFVQEYLSGRTPFPCAKCNNELKWKLIFEEAARLGCDKVAMGHYALINHEKGMYFIGEAPDKDKDQSFFLWGLQQKQLANILFPLGDLHKTAVRKQAADYGFQKIAEKKDSLGACFCAGDYRPFLKSLLKNPENHIYPGDFIDEAGNPLGKHAGYPLYTVGQRRGLGIHLNRAVFVKQMLPESNKIVLAPLKNMYQTSFHVENYHLVDESLFSENFDTYTRIRYRKQNTLSKITVLNENRIKVELADPLESIAPGQTAVFYRNGNVLGGGFIAD